MSESRSSRRRELLLQAVSSFIVPELAAEADRAVQRVLDASHPEHTARFFERLASTGQDWGYHPPDELARALNHALGEVTITAESSLRGAGALQATSGQPPRRLLVANHLSFSDANLLSYLLTREGHDQLAARLCVLAGPKVFTEPFRRFSSLSFGSLKVPQSQDRASGEAVMSRREVARLSHELLAASEQRLAAGDLVLIFVEGTRSREHRMQAALPAVSRYLEAPDLAFVPVGISGSERLVPIGEERAHRTRVDVSLGAPLSAARLFDVCGGKRTLVMDVVGLCIAEQLPPEYRGVYDPARPELAAARAARELL